MLQRNSLSLSRSDTGKTTAIADCSNGDSAQGCNNQPDRRASTLGQSSQSNLDYISGIVHIVLCTGYGEVSALSCMHVN